MRHCAAKLLADVSFSLQRYADAEKWYATYAGLTDDPKQRALANLEIAACRYEQGKNEARIRQLRHMLDHARIGSPETEEGQAAHGMIITVDVVGADRQIRFLLGSREEAAHAPADLQVVSPTSPMGAAVDGAMVGDQVTYTTPAGKEMQVRLAHVEPYVG